MSIITLGGTQYITESIGDETVPAHNYDEVIDISKSEDPDQWFGRVQAEWPSLPPEIKAKVVNNTSEYIGKMTNEIAGTTPDSGVQSDAPLDEAVKDHEGNEIYDFAEGRKHAKSLDNESLMYVRQDLINVIKVQEVSHKQGYSTPKLGYYWDEYWTVVDEIARRMKAGQTFQLEPWSLEGQPVDDKTNELGE